MSANSARAISVSKKLEAFKKAANAEDRRFEDILDTEYWVCVCFESREQKNEFLRWLEGRGGGEDLEDEKHIDGLRVAEALGANLTSPRVRFPKTRSTI